MNQSEVNKRVKQAEKDVLVQFSGAETTQVISPVLAILSKALVTHEGDFDPMLAMHELLRSDLSDLDRHHMQLASSAILDIYADNQSSKSVQAKRLSPEDQRFIELLRQIAASKS